MKNYKEKFIGGIISGLGITLVIGISGIAYGAYVAISDVAPNDTLTASTFNQVLANIDSLNTTVTGLSNIPTGFVGAFNLASCPSGWTDFTSGNGRVIVGVGSDGQANNYSLLNTGGEARHTLTISEIPSHVHQEHYTGGSPTANLSNIGVHGTTNSAGNIPGINTEATGGGQSHENRMPYIVLRYCVKQ